MIFQESTLNNGVRVVTAAMPYVRSVSVALWVKVGSRYETKRQNGISHFVEHLLFKGTFNRSAQKIMMDVEGIGGELDAFTTEDHTCYYARASTSHLPQLLEVLTDMFMHSVFDPTEIEREREVICEEIKMYNDQPAQYVEELLMGALWPGHPLGRPVAGTTQSIEALRREDFLNFVQKHYNGSSLVITVAGGVSHQEVLNLLTPLIAPLPRGTVEGFVRCDTSKIVPTVAADAQDNEQTQLALAFPAMGRNSPQRYVLNLLSVMLGENMSSRLFQKLREQHGLCYSVSTSVTTMTDTGAFQFFAGMDPDNIEKALKLTFLEFENMKKGAFTQHDLFRAKEYAIGQMQLGLESSVNQTMWLGESLVGYGEIIQPEDVEKALNDVTKEKIQTVANEVLNRSRMAMAMVGPDANTEDLEVLRVI